MIRLNNEGSHDLNKYFIYSKVIAHTVLFFKYDDGLKKLSKAFTYYSLSQSRHGVNSDQMQANGSATNVLNR